MNNNVRAILPTDNYFLSTKKIINMIKNDNVRTSILSKLQKEKQDSKNDYLKVLSTCLGELLCAIPVILVEQLLFLEKK